MLRNDTRNISVVICDIDTVMTKPQRTLVSVVCLLAATRYQGNDHRNQTKWQSRMDMNIIFPLKKYFIEQMIQFMLKSFQKWS